MSTPTDKPERIQRQRKRGWRKPPNTVCVNRGTLYGNPFVIEPEKAPGTKLGQYIAVPTRSDALACFRIYLKDERNAPFVALIKKRLRGKNLACFCALNEKCHADILLRIANV